ncbi:MAG: YeeE/YedE family protein [Rhodospirillales bacterium]
MENFSVSTIVGSAGFAAGIVFGFTANRTNFCTMGALSDMVFMGSLNRLRSWLLAIAVAIAGAQGLHGLGVLDIYSSIYLTSNFGWLGAILGGFMFGFGMTMTGGCAARTLVRIGGGNLKSVIVIIIMGIFAYMTLRGLTGLVRLEIEGLANTDLTELGLQSQGMADIIAALAGADARTVRWLLAAVLIAGLLLFCFKDSGFRNSSADITAGLVIGALVTAGWWITGVLGYDDFEPTPLFSFSFVAPAGNAIQYLMTFTGSTINFGIATVGGVILGSFIAAAGKRSFHVETFTDKGDMIRHMFGAAIMGVGGVMAMGCTIGQGISGMSTLSLGSLLSLLFIVFGGVFGLKYIKEGSLGGALGGLVPRR